MFAKNKRQIIFLFIGLIVLVVIQSNSAGADDLLVADARLRVPYNGHLSPMDVRQVYLLNEDWQYLEQNKDFEQAVLVPATAWSRIDLPHTWNAIDATDNEPGYRRDASWYRKDLFIPPAGTNRTFQLYFEAVNISAQVYVNGQFAGGHTGGYVGFTIDITPFIRQGASNQIMVRADNSIEPSIIPSQKSDFVIYGGIVRDVWLKVIAPTFIDLVNIETPVVTAQKGEAQVRVEVVNGKKEMQSIKCEVELLNPSGERVAKKAVSKTLQPGRQSFIVQMPAVHGPALWSTTTPNLYTIKVTLREQTQVQDQVTERFGFRWFEFKERGAFYLNGGRLLLRGTHRHEDYAGYGMAMPNELHKRDMQMIKEVGANFVRLAHYPQDPEVYLACDELGLLVWDELPWCRGGMGGKVWQSNTSRLLLEQIRQNFNHPSIILWSLGNELDWLPDFPGGDDPDSLRVFFNSLNQVAHRLDPGRPTSVRKYYGGADIVDVFSPSIWAGWYSGIYKTYQDAIAKARKTYRRFFHAEYGGDSHVGRHNENPITGEGLVKADEWSESSNMINVKNISQSGDGSENYIVDLFDWHLHISEQTEWLTGNAQWAFNDFATPLRPTNSIPFMNQKGLCDRNRIPKDAYYVFKSYWTTERKFCYIESHTWTERSGPPDLKRLVCVFSNCEQVELFLNGQALGRKERDIKQYPACGLNWQVGFLEGSNFLRAIGTSADGKVAEDTLTINYSYRKHGNPGEINLSTRPLANGHVLIVARVVDDDGLLCLDYNKRVYFDHNGAGKLLVHRGTPTGSASIEFANGKAAIELVPGDGRAVIEARNQDFKGSYLIIENRQKGINLLEIDRERILQKANHFLTEPPVTITASFCPRSSGGLHDYYSEGDYWWPNPDDPDGPYIRRDGLTNPGNFDDHREFLRRMSVQVATLAAAYKISADDRYAQQALKHLRAWFLHDSTRMNPSLQYAQAIKGVSKGRGVGIIDTIHLVEVARAIAVLHNSAEMSSAEYEGIKEWFVEYLHWMVTSANGIDERDRKNNHGTCWVMQVAEFARLTGDKEQIDFCRDRFREVLLPDQMALDGSFPLELGRTKPYAYSLFNLEAMAVICQILSTPQDDLWAFQLADGRGMKRAFEFMFPYIENKSKWPYAPDVMYFDEWPMRQSSLLFAGLAFSEDKYIDLWKKLKPEPETEEGLRNFPLRQPVLWLD